MLQEMARVAARMQLRTLSSFREVYTREVVTKVQKKGIKISHNFAARSNTIPLPATMTRLIGDNVGDLGSSSKVFLYSKYPFPWNEERGGLNDFFRRDAWEYLTKNPDKTFSREEQIGTKLYLRYAQADLMKKSCIECHNTHPDSPKTDWKLNDVRGVLEAYIPIDQIGESIEDKSKTISLLEEIGRYFFVIIIFLGIITFIRDGYRKNN